MAAKIKKSEKVSAKKEKAPIAAKKEKAPRRGNGMISRGARKLSNAQVIAIVENYNSGMSSQSSLAKKHGVSVNSISAIIRGRTYVWLTGIGQKSAAPIAQAA